MALASGGLASSVAAAQVAMPRPTRHQQRLIVLRVKEILRHKP
jgi:hypothetical protein